MAIQRNTLDAYRHVKPYHQGELSKLCGIYAAINAARLITPERSDQRELWASIYNFAASKLSAKRKLKSALSDGLSFDAWKHLLHAIYDELSKRTGQSYHMRPLIRRSARKRGDLAGAIQAAIDAERPLLCALSGTLDHYTVIAGYTPSSWLLHDSCGLRWVVRANTDIGHAGSGRHWIPRPSLVVLYRAEKRI
ncbi:MAG: hypothetical protein AB7V46_13120 [Thermomicrobiales bacterium]